MSGDATDRSRNERAVQERAQALVASGGIVAAVKLLDGFLAQFDGDWGLWLYFAGLCARSGRKDQAVAAYCASSRQLEGEGFFARARAALVCAVKLAPRDGALAQELERVGRLALLPREKMKAVSPAPEPSAQLTMLLPPLRSPPRKEPRPVPRSDPFVALAPPRSSRPDPFASLPPVVEASVQVRRALRSEPFAALPSAPRRDPFALLAPVESTPSHQVTRLGRPARGSTPAPRPPDPAMHVTSLLPGRAERKRTRRPAPVPDFQTDPYLAIFDILDAERSGNPW